MRTSTLMMLLAAPLALAACDSAQETETMEDRAMDGMAMEGHDMSAMDAVDGVDALLIATEWKAFRAPDFDELQRRMKAPVIFDGRNVYELDRMENLGFTYHSIGRKSILASETITTNE